MECRACRFPLIIPALSPRRTRIFPIHIPILIISRSSSSSSNDKEEPKPRKARIYTRTGDKGTTSLYSGERVSKTHSIIATLGDNDELTSQLGVTLEFCRQHPVVRAHLEEQLLYIQCRLQELNSHIATPGDGEARRVLFDVKGTVVAQLERWIDDLDVKLPPLTTFILPVCMWRLWTIDSRLSCSRAEWPVPICTSLVQCVGGPSDHCTD